MKLSTHQLRRIIKEEFDNMRGIVSDKDSKAEVLQKLEKLAKHLAMRGNIDTAQEVAKVREQIMEQL